MNTNRSYTELFALENKGQKISVFSSTPTSELLGNKSLQDWCSDVHIVVKEDDIPQIQKMLKTQVLERNKNEFYSTGKIIGQDDSQGVVVLERSLVDIVSLLDAAETYASTHDGYSSNLQSRYVPRMAKDYGIETGRVSKKEIMPISSAMNRRLLKMLPM